MGIDEGGIYTAPKPRNACANCGDAATHHCVECGALLCHRCQLNGPQCEDCQGRQANRDGREWREGPR